MNIQTKLMYQLFWYLLVKQKSFWNETQPKMKEKESNLLYESNNEEEMIWRKKKMK